MKRKVEIEVVVGVGEGRLKVVGCTFVDGMVVYGVCERRGIAFDGTLLSMRL
jgi:hypothetical protein